MTIYKLTVPNDVTCVIGDRHSPTPLWMISGRAYTNSEAVVAFADRQGYDVAEVPAIPAVYLEQAARLNAYPGVPMNAGAGDGANPEQKYLFTGPDGQTQVDIRDVIAGRVTA
ncbi:hypothetical protein [Microbacterium aerolatum]|uniref:hypothetical protein n=1 Tax=Microbacterium aerolatum TaxID=153731 RepID=UPI00384CA57A